MVNSIVRRDNINIASLLMQKYQSNSDHNLTIVGVEVGLPVGAFIHDVLRSLLANHCCKYNL